LPVPGKVKGEGYAQPPGSAFNAQGFLVDMATQQPILMNDLSLGQYDVEVSVGASQGTKRQTNVNFLLELIRAYPPLAPVVGDLLAKNLDFEYGEELARRMQAFLQAQMGPPPGAGGPPGLPPPGAPGQGQGAPALAPNGAMDQFGNSQSPLM